MDPDHDRLESILANALEIQSETERQEFIRQACGDNAALRTRADELIRNHLQAGSFLGRGVCGAQGLDSIPEGAGSIIGPYKLKEQIGEGGFGLVFVAEQQEPLKRRVALKVIKPGMDTREVLARFTAERQALALMDHPNIARVLDAGATDSGRPYFVMELVRGIPITEYCDKHQLAAPDRLELFISVCLAVQHAHQKGIIHRDLKPSNVLVTSHDGKPVAKVIDFGVAKAINQQLSERSIYTSFAQMIGTPLYMSPEQAEMSGLDIDTRSDIYSLGVLLYELLTGTTPFDKKRFARAAYDEIRRVIREEDPPKPSTRVSTSESIASIAANRNMEPAKLSKLFRGDLDWITMKALEKDRTRRYESANGLARDIQRYLSDEPVEACPPSSAYRMRKFARKNRAVLATAAAIALLLVVGVAVSAWQAVRATRAEAAALRAQQAERDMASGERLAKLDAQNKEKIAVELRIKAERARDRTREVLDAMTSSVTSDWLGTQKEISAEQKKFLTEVLTYYREFADEKADDEQARYRTAGSAFRVGRIESRLGRKEQAIAAYRMAQEGYRALAADFPAVPSYPQLRADALHEAASILRETGKNREALEQYRESMGIFEKLAADFPDAPGYLQKLGGSHNNLGILLAKMGKAAEAEEEYYKALAIAEKLATNFPDQRTYQISLAHHHNNLGNLLCDLGRITESVEQHQKAIVIREKMAADVPGAPMFRQQLADSYNNLGYLLATTNGNRAEAEALYRKSLDLMEKLAADFPSVPDHRIGLGTCYCNYGDLLRDDGHAGESLVWFDKSIATVTPIQLAEPRDLDAKQTLCDSHWSRAMAYDDLAQYAEAIKDWERTAELAAPEEKMTFRVRRATSQLHAGSAAEPLAEVEELVKLVVDEGSSPESNAGLFYALACFYSVASSNSGVPGADQQQNYVQRAVEMLKRAVKKGYNDAESMANDPDLDPLREREDYKNLLAELTAPRK